MIAPGWIAVARRLPWRWLAGAGIAAALLVGCWWHGHARYRAGVAAENARWEAVQAKAATAAATRAEQQRQAVAAAETADSGRRVELRRVLVPIREEVIRYVQTNPDAGACLDGALRLRIEDSISAANATAAGAAKGG